MDDAPADAAGTPLCAVHPEAPATFTCARCGSFGCGACLAAQTSVGPVCHRCADRGVGSGLPWERWREIGLWRSGWQTTKLALRSPTRCFRTPALTPGPGLPLGYGAAVYTVGQLGYALTLVLVFVVMGIGMFAAMPEGSQTPEAVLAPFGCMGFAIVPMVVILAPVQALVGILVAAVCAHGTLALLGSARASFEQTLRAVSYANAPYALFVIPCIGPLVALCWVPALEVIALREVHDISTGKASVAAFGWRIALTLLIVGAYVAFFAMMFAAVQEAGA